MQCPSRCEQMSDDELKKELMDAAREVRGVTLEQDHFEEAIPMSVAEKDNSQFYNDLEARLSFHDMLTMSEVNITIDCMNIAHVQFFQMNSIHKAWKCSRIKAQVDLDVEDWEWELADILDEFQSIILYLREGVWTEE